ncbi:AbrB/MazE/SpoVT family DNA-binding domain-containing protein [Candidatus Woesearchaeota archaeon]|nr:AbrB/MazE/SpoVT family DNA-binding domain-containing protein [Candidatus Woesearchaeota archaeon]
MQRKVSKIGPSTLMVSLPSKWVKKYNVKKGDSLEVLEEGKSLHIYAEKTSTEAKKVHVKLEQENATLARYYLAAAYRSGADEIEVHLAKNTIRNDKEGKDEDVHDFLQRTVEQFIGMGIMRNTPSLYVVKELAAVKEEEFDTTLRRIFFSLMVTNDDLITNSRKNNSAALNHLFQYADTQVNRLVDYCLRMLEKTKMMNPVLYTVILHLEEFGDGLKYIAKQAAQKKVDATTLALIEQIKQLLILTEKYFYGGKSEVLVEYEATKRVLREKLNEAEKISDPVIWLKINKMMGQTAGIINAKLLMQCH